MTRCNVLQYYSTVLVYARIAHILIVELDDQMLLFFCCGGICLIALRLFHADGRWGPNIKMFVNAVGMHPDRLTNMYFAYVFVLRAIGKARPFLNVSFFYFI